MADGALALSKHHGAGNDFLVLLDPDGIRPLSGPEARALCDRHRGVGADGVLRAVPAPVGSPAHLGMELRNADGSTAEMSGNGIRCFVQAAVRAGLVAPGPVRVATAAGLRTVDYHDGEVPGLAHASVAMGAARLGPEEQVAAALPGARLARMVDMGNPHLVVVGEPVDDAVVAGLGPVLSRRHEAGANVEFVWHGDGPGEFRLRVWERGVGETLACGTGACAVAAAAASWGLVTDHAVVHSPGGTLEVDLGDDIVLAGPTVHVADLSVAEATLAALVQSLDPLVEVSSRT